jgi:ATP-dependent DNA helicase RecG
MSTQFVGPDPVQQQLDTVLAAIAAGTSPHQVEHRLVDCKEEPGRRGKGGAVLPGATTNETAATYLAREAACFANSDDGGALIIGVSDKGQLIGTALDCEWLRHRIYELTQHKLTVTAYETTLANTRLVIFRIPEALEPIPHKGRLTWRVGDNCVEVDTASWWSGKLYRVGSDWSGRASGHALTDARAIALEISRDFLRDSRDPANTALAEEPDADLLTRLNLVTADQKLTNAGALLFVGRATPALDYIRRDAPGGDSRRRLNSKGRSVLEELRAVEEAIDAFNPVEHLHSGLAAAQISAIPRLAAREALVNAIAHRDWTPLDAVVVEHVGNTLIVNNPGGFVGGVTADNIITHPSQTRNRSLADVLAKLGVAEREGIGVDRMVRDMIRFGHPRPVIEEVTGPRVRAVLVGSMADAGWIAFLDALDPRAAAEDLDLLLVLNLLLGSGWVDSRAAAPYLQKSEIESSAVLQRLAATQFERDPVVQAIPSPGDPAYRLSDKARDELAARLTSWLPSKKRADLVVTWAGHRGRVSTTEIADIVGTTVARASQLLKSLEDDGLLAPGRANRQGRGFFYVPI